MLKEHYALDTRQTLNYQKHLTEGTALPMLYAAAFLLVLVFWFGIHAWRARNDVWVNMHGASLFKRGETIQLHSTSQGVPARGRVLKVTRSALLVRPVK